MGRRSKSDKFCDIGGDAAMRLGLRGKKRQPPRGAVSPARRESLRSLDQAGSGRWREKSADENAQANRGDRRRLARHRLAEALTLKGRGEVYGMALAEQAGKKGHDTSPCIQGYTGGAFA
jgi:hypothetical protein